MSKIYSLDIHPDFQPLMDFGKLKNEPDWDMRFCIVKSSEGYGYEVRRYQDYIDRIKDADLLTGSYHYFYATDGDTKWEAEAQAAYYVEIAGETDLTYALDLEDRQAIDHNYVTPEKVKDGALWCLDEIEKITGRIPMLYTGNWFMDMIPNDNRFLKYPLWVASYGDNDAVDPSASPYLPEEWRNSGTDWIIHQFSSKYQNIEVAKGGYEWPIGSEEWHRNGLPANCDINKTTEEKLASLLLDIPPTPEPTPPQTPTDCTDSIEIAFEQGRVAGKVEVRNAVQDTLDSFE